MAQLCEASAILKRLTERLYRYNNWEHQADIDSLQDILSSPLFHTLYNLQESFAQLKAEYEKGNHLIRECRFDFDIHGRLQLLHRTDTNPNTDNYTRLSDKNIVRQIRLDKQTSTDSLGITLVNYKHRRVPDIQAIFIANILANSIAARNAQLRLGDQLVCINTSYFDSRDPAGVVRAEQLLSDRTQLSIELLVIAPSPANPHAAVSTSKSDGRHSCVRTLSTSLQLDMVLNTLWTQIEIIELTNDGSGLGFGISGNKSTGVVIKAIVPGSIVDKDGRIRPGDHLFQINHVCVRGMSSEQVAGILRQCSQQVRLVVARSIREPSTAASETPPFMSQRPSVTSEMPSLITTNGLVSPATNIDHDGIITSSQNKLLLRTERLLESNHNLEKILENLREQCQYEDGTELLDVTLEKGDDGLGITVAGYVSPDSTNHDAIAGIFIRDIAPDSVCARDARLAIGDQIVEVNDQSLNGFSNVQALYLLQNTSSSVQLKVRRYLDGIKYEKIKEMIVLEPSTQVEEKFEFPSPLDIHDQIRQKWAKVVGEKYEILIADIYKPDNGGLGITLEGTVDIENGEEVRPHHYIRALLRDGPVATEGTLRSGDELLEVNNQVLYGKNHIHVIEILKRIKHKILLVCARRRTPSNEEVSAVNQRNPNRSRSISFGKTAEIVVKAKSMGTLDSNNLSINLLSSSLRTTNPCKSRSLEVISNLALWSTSIVNIELHKGDHGLGFSVLDYQDPSNPSHSPVIVIRALVPGGVAQLDGRIVPGDRLVAVNDITLENMNLDDVIQILKSTPKGPVKLSLSQPLPYPKFRNDHDGKVISDSDQETTNANASVVPPPARSSRLSKSQTSTSVMSNHQRSASSHRPSQSSSSRRAAVPVGIALSAPAILSQHEYIESLLNKENMRKKTEQRASSANRSSRREKISARFPSFERKELPPKQDGIRQLNTEQYLDLLPKNNNNRSLSSVQTNLPEFLHFQSDHLVLSSDRSRGSSAFSLAKSNRQSTNLPSPTPTGATSSHPQSGSSPRASYATGKRSARSRQAHDSTINYGAQPVQAHLARPSSFRQMTSKFDAIGCFHEPDLSSDDDHQQQKQQHHHHHYHPHQQPNSTHNVVLSSSSSSSSLLDHPQATSKHVTAAVATLSPATTSTLDEDAHEVDAIIKQHQRLLTNHSASEHPSVSTPPIKTPTTPTITSKWTSSRQPSRMASPALSTSSQSSGRVITFLNHEVIQLPVYLEREIRVKSNFDQLGLVVDAYVDEGVNGCCIRSMAPTASAANQHVLRPGDYLLSINNESMKKISNAQARSVIRRASLIGSDISVIFIPGDGAKQFKDHTLDPQAIPSPIPLEMGDAELEPLPIKPVASNVTDDGDSYGFDSQNNQQTYSTVIDSETLSATLWGTARTVTLYRNEHVKSLGISIVGGKLDFSGPGNTIESCISGIFIKHVLPDSPAGRNGTLKTGDRILEVNGFDLREASHDRAVEIIRAAQSPVHLIVQSLLDPSNPTSSTADQSSLNHLSDIPSSSPASPQSKILSPGKYSLGTERKTEEELIKQYGHLQGDLLFIEIKRALAEINEPLGLSLIGHRDPNKLAVFVCDIQPGSLLDRDHRILPGDQLLEVNGEILLGKAHSTVTPTIKSIKAETLNFVVLRNPNAINDMALNNQHAVAARLRASVMTSPTLARGQDQSPASLQDFQEQQMTNEASHQQQQHLAHVPRQSPDVNEQKETNDGLASSSVVSSSSITQRSDNSDRTINKNEEKSSTLTTAATRDEKCLRAEEIPTSSSSNRIIASNDVQNSAGNNNNVVDDDDNGDVLSFNHNISSNATITAFHSISSDVSSPVRRFMPSSVDQQAYADETDESLPTFPSSPLLSSLLMHEQPNHANDKARGEEHSLHTILKSSESQCTPTDPPSSPSKEKKSEERSPTHASRTQSDELSTLTKTSSVADVIVSSPPQQTTDEQLAEPSAMASNTNTNGATTSHMPMMSSSSSSSSSLSVSTPSSAEHLTKRLPAPTQTPRRASMSTPGAPITLILNKDQKGSFGLTLSQRDQGIWVQSVQPHGSADQQDVRAGDQLMQINGTSVEVLKFAEIQNMLEHANSNQIHLTCVPYREPQAQPVVVTVNQSENLPSVLLPTESDASRDDDPRTRSIAVGQETCIEIDRGQSGLGLSVVGGSDTQLSAIIVHDIYDGCAAQRDGRLHVGDQILEVNSFDLRSATHDEAIQALRQATNIVQILVLRGKVLTEMTNEQDKFDIILIELIKKSGKGLGFSIIGRRHGYGVFISHILEGGCAEKDGRLMSGDLILEVNGQDLRTAAYEHVAYTLKTLPHGRVTIKIGRLKASARPQTRQNSLPHDRKARSRSSSSNLRRSSAHKINDR